MKFISKPECIEILGARIEGIDVLTSSLKMPCSFVEKRRPLPKDSGKKVVLARVLMNHFFQEETEGLIWIQNWMIWPSSGYLPILQRYRESMGENRDIENAPAAIFLTDQISDATSFIVMSLEFYWDCLVVTGSGLSGFRISHDEYYSFFSRNDEIVDSFEQKSNRLSI